MKCVRDHGPCSVGAADVVWFDFFSEFDLLTGISVESIKPAEDECSEHNSLLLLLLFPQIYITTSSE